MAKRSNGEGSVHLRQDGRWAASISVGKGKRKHFLGHTRAEVAARLTAALNDQNKGLPVRFERQNVRDFMTGWLDSVQPSLKPRTHQRYEQLLRCHAFPAIGKTSLEKLTPQNLQRLYTSLLADGSSPGTVRQLHAVLHRALRQAVLWGLTPRNVADAVTSPKSRREEMKTLTEAQARQLLAAAEGDRFEALFVSP